jgi:hypothetical protein
MRTANLKQGQIKELCEDAFSFPPESTSPRPNTISDDDEPSFDNETQFSREAQAAANSDNFHAAHQRILSSLPIVKLHPATISKITDKTLFPPRLPRCAPQKETNSQSSQSPGTRSRIQEQSKSNRFRRTNSDDTLATLRKTKRGTAPGPFCDPIDALQDYAIFRPQPSESDAESESTKTNSTACPCIDNFTSLVQLTLDGNTPKQCQSAFSCTYFLALHKDPNNLDHKDPNNLDKVRPLGIGSALRRLCAAYATTVLGADAAEHLLEQGQFGIGIPSGLDFIIHSTMADVQRHLDPTAPTRAMLLIDIVNMFNAVSREACRSVLKKHEKFNALIPFFLRHPLFSRQHVLALHTRRHFLCI